MDIHLAAIKILVCEISGRDGKTSSCNHDMKLVISGMTFVFIGPYWFSEK